MVSGRSCYAASKPSNFAGDLSLVSSIGVGECLPVVSQIAKLLGAKMKRAIEASSGQVLIEIAARYFRSTEVASLVGERAMPGRSD
jgi:hypothetical protein